MPSHSHHPLSRSLRRAAVRLARSLGRRHGPVNMADPIGGAVRDAELLVAFAAQSNRRIAGDKVALLVAAAAAVSAAQAAGQVPGADLRVRFWTAYDAVAVEMAPVSAESIRSSLQLNGRPIYLAPFTQLGGTAWFAVIVFFACVALQVLWVAGRDLVERSEALDKDRIELRRKMTDNTAALERTKLLLQAKACSLPASFSAPVPCKPGAGGAAMHVKFDPARSAAIQAELDLLAAQMAERQLEDNEMQARLLDLRTRGKPVEILLQRWHERAERVCSWPYLHFICLSKQPSEAGPPAVGTPGVLRSAHAAAPAFADGSRPVLARTADDPARRAAEEEEDSAQMVVEIRLIVANLGNYLIALAMGVLGALTFILRTTTQQLRDHTYVPVTISMSMVRICLGAIAGVFGSLLMPSADPTLKSLPPLFIPFLFGYAIEILFSMMDKVVGNFTQANAPAATGKP